MQQNTIVCHQLSLSNEKEAIDWHSLIMASKCNYLTKASADLPNKHVIIWLRTCNAWLESVQMLKAAAAWDLWIEKEIVISFAIS